MALPLTKNDEDHAAALPTLADWLRLGCPARWIADWRLALARRRLQRRAALALSAGDCTVLADLIVRGQWDELAALADRLEAR